MGNEALRALAVPMLANAVRAATALKFIISDQLKCTINAFYVPQLRERRDFYIHPKTGTGLACLPAFFNNKPSSIDIAGWSARGRSRHDDQSLTVGRSIRPHRNMNHMIHDVDTTREGRMKSHKRIGRTVGFQPQCKASPAQAVWFLNLEICLGIARGVEWIIKSLRIRLEII